MNKIDERVYHNNGNEDLVKEINFYNKKNFKILDIGCGNGDIAKNIVLKSNLIDGITISSKEAGMAKTVMRNVLLHDLEKGLPLQKIDSEYDFIICSHVLEHICYPEMLLNDIYKLMHNESILIVCLPNIMHYKSRLELLKGNFYYDQGGVWDSTHFKWYTYSTAIKLLEKNNFKLLKSYVSGQMPFGRLTKFIPKIIKKNIFNILQSISKGFFGDQLVYVARKH